MLFVTLLMPTDIRHHVLDDAKLFLGSDAAGKDDSPVSHVDIDVCRIERDLLIETIADESAQLAVGLLIDLVDVLVISFHRSSGSAVVGVQVTGRSTETRRA